jgi:hypothetical protein
VDPQDQPPMQRASSPTIRSSLPFSRVALADSIWHDIDNFDYSRAFIGLLTPRSGPAYTIPTAAIS